MSVAFSPDGKRLASASLRRDGEGVGRRDRAGNSHLSQTASTDSNVELVMSVAFSPDGKRLASASYGWDGEGVGRRDGQETLTLKGHLGKPRWSSSVAFSPDGKRLASAGARIRR